MQWRHSLTMFSSISHPAERRKTGIALQTRTTECPLHNTRWPVSSYILQQRCVQHLLHKAEIHRAYSEFRTRHQLSSLRHDNDYTTPINGEAYTPRHRYMFINTLDRKRCTPHQSSPCL
ncbi:hypothetical protein AX14_001481 [Amanita brunnescens Koide BX004]|nr:hypothetical protein AX14_001481 [Amanita brunnescens Koide BX004]